jgi:hypothetical protein
MFAALLDKLSLGTPSTHGDLTLTPILLKGGSLSPLEPMALEEALAAGLLKVSEVSDAGSVPELRVKSTSDAAVLILDGEELVGAKQNRIVNTTILVPPLGEIVIPVSCIEAGRWGYSRAGFAAAERVLSHEIRAAKSASVTRSLKSGGVYCSDQHEVWDGVERTLGSLGTSSRTRALSDGYTSHGADIDGYLGAFTKEPSQVGVVYRIRGILAGLDLFGSERSFASAFPKLLRGSALQALAGYGEDGQPRGDERLLLRRALEAQAESFPAVGLGESLRIDTADVGGGALRLDSDLIHLFAFARRVREESLAAA